MKKISICFALFAVLLSGCKDDETEISTREQTITTITTGSWIADEVNHATDGNLTFQYESFSIRFTKGNVSNYDGEYYVVQGGNAFPQAYGKWRLNNELSTILLDNGTDLDFELTANTLVLDFMVAPPAGRVDGLSGHFTFNLIHP